MTTTNLLPKVATLVRKELEQHRLTMATLDVEQIAKAAMAIAEAMAQGGRLWIIGNGGSAAMAMHVAGEFLGRFKAKRDGLPGMALTDPVTVTAIANDFGVDVVFERQVRAVCGKGDVLWAMSTSGRSENITRGLRAAARPGAVRVAMAPENTPVASAANYVIHTKPEGSDRVQEAQLTAAHIICGLVETMLVKRKDETDG